MSDTEEESSEVMSICMTPTNKGTRKSWEKMKGMRPFILCARPHAKINNTMLGEKNHLQSNSKGKHENDNPCFLDSCCFGLRKG